MKANGKIVLGLLLLHGFLCFWAASGSFTTNDEYAAHITSGFLYWNTGTFPGGVNNPPLGQLWVSFPMIITGMELHPFNNQGIWIPRLANILLSLGLLYWVYIEARRLFGQRGGIIALATGALSPTLISNSSLANLDLPITFVFFGAIVLFWRYLRKPGWKNLALFSIVSGAALLTKVTAFYLLPIYIAMIFLFLVYKGPRRYLRLRFRNKKQGFGALALHLLAASILVVLVINAGYLFQGSFSSKLALIESSMSSWPSFIKVTLNYLMLALPTGFVEATLGKIQYASAGNATFLLGQHSTTGWWWYYPVCLLLKVPLIYIAFIILALYCPIRYKKISYSFPWLIIVSFLLFAIFTNKAQIGIRHLLPIFPFAFIAIGSLATLKIRSFRLVYISGGMYILCKLILIMPYPLSFTSILTMGNGYKWMADSNFDWGQGNQEIQKTLQENPSWKIPQPHHPESGTFIIRSNHLLDFHSKDKESFAWLRSFKPQQRIASTGLVFNISSSDLETGTFSLLDTAVYEAFTGNWETASDLFKQVRDTHPTPWEIISIQASLQQDQNQEMEAYRTLRKGTRLYPENLELLSEYSILEGKLKGEKSLSRNPAQAYYLLANYEFLSGNMDKSFTNLSKAQENGLPDKLYFEVLFRINCLSGNWKEALDLLQHQKVQQMEGYPPLILLQSINDQTAGTDDYFSLGYFAFQNRRWAVAADNFLQALRLDPSNKDALNYLGQLVVFYHDQSVPISEDQEQHLKSLVY
jgi:dolichyl-phosphate-mannose-protein mannosyltransferase